MSATDFIAQQFSDTAYKSKVVSSITALRTVGSEMNLFRTPYSSVFVTGYYAPGDGGGGAYYPDANDTTSADNGGTIIVGSDGTRWKLQETATLQAGTFGVSGDGVLRQTEFTAFEAALLACGGVGMLPEGKINVGTWRASWTDTDMPASGVVLQGNGSTLVLQDIAETIAQNGAEPSIFKLTGTSGTQYLTNLMFKDFDIDYSAQVFKGGASMSTPAETDIVPYRSGTTVFEGDFLYKVHWVNVNMSEVYGDGIRCIRSTDLIVSNCNGLNVSGGNPGLADSNGGFIAFMLSMGCSAVNCTAWNTRQYQTDTVSGIVTSTAKGTPCGYIGFWTEFSMSNNLGSLPPFANAWLSTTGNDDNVANYRYIASLSNTFTGCVAYGYTMGFKAEGQNYTTFDKCVALNCWLSFVSTNSVGTARDCFSDQLALDGVLMPYAGYAAVRGHYLAYNPGANAVVDEGFGFIFDGCGTHTKQVIPFCSTCHFAKFLNQKTFIDVPAGLDVPAPFFFPYTGGDLYGIEILGGEVYIKGQNKDVTVAITAARNLKVDLSVYNTSSYFFQFGLNVLGFKAKIRSTGYLKFDMSNTYDAELSIDYQILSANISSTAQYLIYLYIQSARNKVKVTYAGPTNGLTQSLVEYNGEGNEIDVAATFTDGGSNTFQGLVSTTSGGASDTYLKRLHVLGDVYNLPLVYTGAQYGIKIGQVYTNSVKAPLFQQFYGTLNGPILISGPVNVNHFSNETQSYDPNSVSGIQPNVGLIRGQRFPYIFPVLGGKEGTAVISEGRNCVTAWSASASVTAGSYVKTGGNAYQYTVGGTTSSTAPTDTTGNAFTDGSATAKYIGPAAVLAEYGAIASSSL